MSNSPDWERMSSAGPVWPVNIFRVPALDHSPNLRIFVLLRRYLETRESQFLALQLQPVSAPPAEEDISYCIYFMSAMDLSHSVYIIQRVVDSSVPHSFCGSKLSRRCKVGAPSGFRGLVRVSVGIWLLLFMWQLRGCTDSCFAINPSSFGYC